MTSEFIANAKTRSNLSNPFRFILSHILAHPWLLILLIIGAFSNAALAAAIPAFIGMAFEAVINGEGAEAILSIAVMIVASQTIRSVLQFIRNFSAETYGQMIERDVRDELYASLLGKSMTFHDLTSVGDIMARVTNDVRELNLMMNPGINLIIGSGFFLIAPVIAAPLIYPDLILVPLAFVILHLIVQIRFIRTLHPITESVRVGFGQMNSRLAEALDGVEVIKGSAQEKNEVQRFASLADTVRDRIIKQGKVEARYLSTFLMGLAVVAGFVHAAVLYQSGQIVLGDVASFVILLYLFGFPVFTSLFALSRIASGYASAERILNIIIAQTDLDQNEAGYEAPIKGDIAFEHVDFGYTPDKQVLYDLDFHIKAGQTVAIVGQTGAGKTTVTKLINRIYDATRGRVLVDGVDVRNWKLESLRSQISIIEQDIFLFSRTIAENIAFGRSDATREEIIEAAKKAQAHDFIMSFPDGYDTVIGQRGVTLSGGQRQRLAIARAFLTNPPVLILDDSTSAIDSATEDLIQQAIWEASKGRTTILITHRLSQIRWADHIIVLRQGRIVAQGQHEELLKTSEAYRRIFARYEPATPQPSETQS
ncbi:MAG: ABC transporter ATP-binding protein [Chloroflexi bacterium]|nr:MAG: ABC transporter ATP-binding protein [Chloroflexota bacterium]